MKLVSGIGYIYTRERVISSINEKGGDASVSSIMEKDFTIITPATNLNEVYHILKSRGKTVAAVVEDGKRSRSRA